MNQAADTNNHLSGLTYDAAGNVTNDGLGGSFVFDSVGSDIKADISDGRGSEIISTTYRTPIPAIDIATKGLTRATAGVERDVTGVEFVPAKSK